MMLTRQSHLCFLSLASPPSGKILQSQARSFVSQRPQARNVAKRRPRYFRLACSGASEEGTIRVNKCFKSRFSRRESDALISQGRVTVNGVKVPLGTRVRKGDEVALDGQVVEWERLGLGENDVFSYVKFHKPVGIVTTADMAVENNIISSLHNNGYRGDDRVFTIGRLDEQTSGLILCTSDGALVNAALGKDSPSTKEYLVGTDSPVSDLDIARLRDGVVIKTVAQYSQGRKPLVAPTLPCVVERVPAEKQGQHMLRIVLHEGRNRQIRKMIGAVGNYTVRSIHRVSFMDITLEGIERPGSWALLNDAELKLVHDCKAASDAIV